MADHVRHGGAFGTKRQVVRDHSVLCNLRTGLNVLAHNKVFVDGVGVFSGAGLELQAVCLQEFLSLICGFARKVRHFDFLGSLRNRQVDAGALGFLRLAHGVLADNLAGLYLVGVLLLHGANREAGRLDGGFRLVKRLARDIGNYDLLLAVAVSAKRERADGNKRHHGNHGRNNGGDFLLVVLRRSVVRHIRVALAAFGRTVLVAADCRHNRGAVAHGADRRHVAHDLRLRAGEAAAEHNGATGQVVVERRAHFLCGGEALHGVFRHGLHDDGLKRRIDLGVQLARRHRLVLHLLHGNADGVGAVERQLARGGFVQHDAQRVDVAGGGEFFALCLFRRDIVRRAQHAGRLLFRGVLRTRDAEVHDLHVAVGLHHDVLRLDVAVDDVKTVSHGKRLAHLAADFGDLALIDGAALVNGGFQVGAAHVFHDDVVGAFVLAPVVHVDNVGALQVGSACRFLLEALGEALVCGVLGQHHLYCYHTTQDVILRAVHLGHAADADAFGYLVAVVEHPADHVSGHV